MIINQPQNSWYFYHKVSKKKLGPFSINALCSLMIESGINLDQILVAMPGWKEWKNPMLVADFLSAYQKEIQKQDEILPPISEEVVNFDEDKTKTNVISIEKKLDSPVISNESKDSKENNDDFDWSTKRTHPRFNVELKVVFIKQNKSFRTKTKDLSLGGMKTYDPLPYSFTNTPIDVFISSSDLKISIKFTAEIVSDKKTHSHIKFIEHSQNSIKLLEEWLSELDDSALQKSQNSSFKKSA